MLSTMLREMLQKVVDNSITIPDLEEYLVPRLPYFLDDPASADSDVIAAIELAFVEMNQGVQDENKFKKLISDLLIRHPSVWVNYPIEATSSTSSSSVTSKGYLASWTKNVEFTVELA